MRHRWRRAQAALLAGLLAGATLSGCSGTADPADAGLPAGVTVQLRQWRSDVAERYAEVSVTNDTDSDLAVTRVVLADDWLATEAVRDKASTVPAGRTVDLRVALPVSRCDGAPGAADRRSRVTLTFADGAEGSADIPDPLGAMTLLHQKECLGQQVSAVAALEWTQFTPDAGSTATLTLAVTPSGGDGTLRLVDVLPTNLLAYAATPGAHPLDLVVAGADPPTRVEVPLVPFRCDPHAVMEDKRGTVFPIEVELDGIAGVTELPVPAAMKGRILDWVARSCGFG